MPHARAEIGSPGLPLFAGRLSLDTNVRLRWPLAGRIYRDMLDNEPAAGALRTAVHTLLRTDMQVTPGGKTEADTRAADLVTSCLEDMRFPLGTKLRQAASAYFYGFSVMELVYKRRPDGLVGWADWGLRRAETLERWELDARGRLTAFVQRPAPDYVLRTIPLTKAMHIVADDSEGSPEGRGALRAMYRYWFMVVQFELLFGIALERFGTGLPYFKRTDEGIVLTEEQENSLLAQGEALRQNEQAVVILPPGIDFGFAPSPGLNADTYLHAIQSYRTWMLTSALAEFIALGTGQTGTYALGQSKIDLFLKALTGVQVTICAAINRQAIPRLMALNGFTLDAPPTVSLPAVRNYDLGSLGSFAQVLTQIGAFHPTPEDERWFRAISDLADVDMATLEALHAQASTPKAAPTRDTGDAEDEPMDEDDPIR